MTSSDSNHSKFPISGVSELSHFGVIRAIGEEAVQFLQGQLTQDVVSLTLSEARLAAYCNAKGRMQASFIIFKRSSDEIFLICSQDILAATLKRLSMFVLRAKVKLSDASADFRLYGLAGKALEELSSIYPAWTKTDIDTTNLVFLPIGDNQPRALWCVPANSPSHTQITMNSMLWHWLDVQSGITMITQPIFEYFVPQMLNYESVGGVNFKKGCYPGQEIVARSQYRGTLKRRAYLLHSDTEPRVGEEVFHITDTTQPCGHIAAMAVNPSGGFDVISSMQTSAADDAMAHCDETRLTLGSATGAVLTLLTLPYKIQPNSDGSPV